MAFLLLALTLGVFLLPLAITRARATTDHPTDPVLDEDTETWGPAA